MDISKRVKLAAANKAAAAKIEKIDETEADAEAKYLSGEGMSRQRQAIIKDLETSQCV